MRTKRTSLIFLVLLTCNFTVWTYIAFFRFTSFHEWLVGTRADTMSDTDYIKDLQRTEEEQRRRQYLLKKHCQKAHQGSALSIIIEPSSRVSYCLSRKIASTFWLQVLSYLTLYEEEDLDSFSPLDLQKVDVHLRPKLPFYRIDRQDHRDLIFNTTRFMFVRDPYSRLWSVYLDKFVIMDSWFFNKFGTVILKRKGVKVTNLADVCNEDYHISFQDFLDFVIFWNRKTNGHMDDHFGSVLNHCNPCEYKPDFIGKLESFRQDSKYILGLLNFEGFSDFLQGRDHVVSEMKMLIDYNLYMFKKFKKCFSWCITRMLDAFMMNGYLSYASVQLIRQRLPLNKTELLNTVVSEYYQFNTGKSQVSRLKHEWKVKAYRKVKRKTLLAIEKIYEDEMVMFDYELFPKGIFD